MISFMRAWGQIASRDWRVSARILRKLITAYDFQGVRPVNPLDPPVIKQFIGLIRNGANKDLKRHADCLIILVYCSYGFTII